MQNAQLYARSNDITRFHSERLLGEFLPRMRWTCNEAVGAKGAVLDVGCGPGDLTAQILRRQLAPSVKTLVGMDLSGNMVRHAQANHKNSDLHFVKADIADPDLLVSPLSALGSFCKIFSFYALHWVQDQRTALTNIHRLLRQGGEGLLCFISHSPIFTAYEAFMSHPRWGRYMTDAKTFSSPYQNTTDAEAIFSSALQEAGFNVHYCCNVPVNHYFNSMEDFKGLVESVNPFVQRVPEEDRAEFLEELTRKVHEIVQRMAPDGKGGDDSKPRYYLYTLVAHVEKSKVDRSG